MSFGIAGFLLSSLVRTHFLAPPSLDYLVICLLLRCQYTEYLERPDSPGEKMKLFPSSKRISLRSFLRKNRPLLLPEIVDRIENYKRNKKRLPKSLTELGINDPLDLVGIHYEEWDSTYALYYHAGFEEYYVYRSETRSWEVEHCEK